MAIGIVNYGLGNLRSVQKALQKQGADARVLDSPDGLEPEPATKRQPHTEPETPPIDRLILPGVGAFADGMTLLRCGGWIDPIRRFAASGRPLLGICLGMQLLFTRSQESDASSDDDRAQAADVRGAASDSTVGRGLNAEVKPDASLTRPPVGRPDAAPVCDAKPPPSPSAEPGPPPPPPPPPPTDASPDFVDGFDLLPGDVLAFDGPAFGPGKLKIPHMGWNTLQIGLDDPLLEGLRTGDAVYFVHGYFVEPAESKLTIARCDYGRAFCAIARRDNVWATQFHPEKSQKVGLRLLANFARL